MFRSFLQENITMGGRGVLTGAGARLRWLGRTYAVLGRTYAVLGRALPGLPRAPSAHSTVEKRKNGFLAV